MAKKVYLVDTENVGAVWKHLFKLATVTDDILLFYTENTPFLSYNDLEYILAYKEHFSMIKCYTGNNALDFQLVSYLGFLVSNQEEVQYVIVSNDTGYNSVIHFWNDRGIDMIRLSQVELVQMVSKQDMIEQNEGDDKNKEIAREENGQIHKQEAEEEVENLVAISLMEDIASLQGEMGTDEGHFIQEILSGMESHENICWIVEMLHKYSLKELAKIHSELVKKFGMPAGSQIYQQIKPTLKQFYQSISVNLNQKEKLIWKSLEPTRSEKEIRIVMQILSKYNMEHLQQIYQELLKKFGQEEGIALYKHIKPMLKQFYAD